ncbi:SCP2 sterol-binding domain-containing protein [Thermogymnomonas acidicola]|uniref:SCP2 sterol-binding domain-containing protein n=1 Tax=Thermogymnomonas acidicola TaxID=399579 RepID=UPI0009463F70|nr:SCP2 sterol-binding domain-containing protein [Thermogymnomonas acidicola]
MGYSVRAGKIDDVWTGKRETDYTISGKYSVWVNLLLGRQTVTSAFLSRRLRVDGDFNRILRMVPATEHWLTLLRRVATEFHGDYSKFNLKGE